MSGREPKFSILEIDGTELPGASEYIPVFDDIFNDYDYEDTLTEAINGHAFLSPLGKEIIVSKNRQMINIDGFEIHGQLTINGSFVL